MTKFSLKSLINSIQDENTSIAEDAVSSAEFTGYVDTGSYIFNAAISGSMYNGIPNTKKIVIAGETSVGKTFFSLGIVKNFLEQNPDALVVWYLAEAAVTRKMLIDRGIDTNRFIINEPVTIQDFRHHVVKTLDSYMETTERPPMMMVLDSLGMLSSEKEMGNATAGQDKADVGAQAKQIKSTFRVLELKLARAKVPMIITNHVYDNIGGYGPAKTLAGGSGPKYAGDIIALLSKAKEIEDEEVIGNVITIRMYKNRFAKENTEVKVRLRYDTGLERYYGLLELADEANIFKKVSTRYELPDGSKQFGKEINNNPTKYYTEDVMKRLEEYANEKFQYGKVKGVEVVDVDRADRTQTASDE